MSARVHRVHVNVDISRYNNIAFGWLGFARPSGRSHPLNASEQLKFGLAVILASFFSVSAVDAQRRTPAGPSTSRALTPREIAQRAMPSVVFVRTEDRTGQPLAIGSGFFVGPPKGAEPSTADVLNGRTREAGPMVATNYHVIKDAAAIYVSYMGSHVEYKATLLAIDADHDLDLEDRSDRGP